MSEPVTILVADDEPSLRRVLSAILAREGYEILQAADGEEAIELLRREEWGASAVITDLKMPRLDGMGVLRRVALEAPDIPVIIITAHGTVDNAVEAVKAGAFDYIEKPFEKELIRQVVAKAVKQSEAQRHAPRLPLALGDTKAHGRFGLVGDSPGLKQIYAVIEKVADTPSTVLITGESGTGKELVAKALHEHSSRRNCPFIKINCAAIPKTLMESELFGYEKGAFTGAVGSKPGRFELADKGTLFLDEIGEIPVEMQVKLLRALQESEFERVGGIKTIKVDVRLITATNRDLEKEIKAGNFREDLYYRLNVVPLHIPPLRDRREDIPLLCEHILRKFNERLKKQVDGIDPEALERLINHSWPGNIRELENILERTLLFCDSPLIRVGDLPPEIGVVLSIPGAHLATASPSLLPGMTATDRTGPQSLKDIVRAETERVERELIMRALDETSGNVTQAAKLLKISRKSLQMKMKEFGLRERE
ncbi:MAG: sigma-54-dependent Fis family transcriptional regulator [Deltaproteobacteria bacterium]|nr:sigma-54-dependent Fis family transcriptional regulator [Deltaproteobacteria bacterium]